MAYGHSLILFGQKPLVEVNTMSLIQFNKRLMVDIFYQDIQNLLAMGVMMSG